MSLQAVVLLFSLFGEAPNAKPAALELGGVIHRSIDYTEADYLPAREWTSEIHAAVAECWRGHEADCIRECGGSLMNATDFCRVLKKDRSIVSFGWGCQMRAGYESCAQTFKLRQEVERLRKMLTERAPCPP